MCSLSSANGPSVTSGSPPRTRIVVAADAGWSGPLSTSTPAVAIAWVADWYSLSICMNSGVPGTGSSMSGSPTKRHRYRMFASLRPAPAAGPIPGRTGRPEIDRRRTIRPAQPGLPGAGQGCLIEQRTLVKVRALAAGGQFQPGPHQLGPLDHGSDPRKLAAGQLTWLRPRPWGRGQQQ